MELARTAQPLSYMALGGYQAPIWCIINITLIFSLGGFEQILIVNRNS